MPCIAMQSTKFPGPAKKIIQKTIKQLNFGCGVKEHPQRLKLSRAHIAKKYVMCIWIYLCSYTCLQTFEGYRQIMDTVVRHGENILWYDVGFTVGYSLRPTQCRLTCHLQRSTAPFCTFSAKNCIENSMVGLEFWPLCNSPYLRGYACMSMMEAGEHPQMIILEPWQIFWIFDNLVAWAFDAGSELHSHSSPSCLAWPISQNAS